MLLGGIKRIGQVTEKLVPFNGMMAIPNLIALFLLSGVVAKLVKENVDKSM